MPQFAMAGLKHRPLFFYFDPADQSVSPNPDSTLLGRKMKLGSGVILVNAETNRSIGAWRRHSFTPSRCPAKPLMIVKRHVGIPLYHDADFQYFNQEKKTNSKHSFIVKIKHTQQLEIFTMYESTICRRKLRVNFAVFESSSYLCIIHLSKYVLMIVGREFARSKDWKRSSRFIKRTILQLLFGSRQKLLRSLWGGKRKAGNTQRNDLIR